MSILSRLNRNIDPFNVTELGDISAKLLSPQMNMNTPDDIYWNEQPKVLACKMFNGRSTTGKLKFKLSLFNLATNDKYFARCF